MNPATLRTLNPRRLMLTGVEYALIVGAVLVATVVQVGASGESDRLLGTLWRAGLIGMVLQVCLHYSDLYDLRTLVDRRDLFTRLLRAIGAAAVILALMYAVAPSLIIGRGVFIVASLLIVGLVVGWRAMFERISSVIGPSERLLIVGTDSAAVDLARDLVIRRHELGVTLVGFVTTDATEPEEVLVEPGIVGTVANIAEIVRDRQVGRVVLSLRDARGRLPMDELLAMKLNGGVRFDHLASVYEDYTGRIAVENLRPSWLIFSEGFRKGRTLTFVKRTCDILIAGIGLCLTAPILLMSALAVKCTSSGAAFYHQSRVGKDGRLFTIHKLRSMRNDAEQRTGAVWSTVGDPRVTSVGRFLRRTRIDELPQLWNVLKGDMSLVGPRPERPEFVTELTRHIPFYGLRHAVKPGVTGWAQVRHAYGSSTDDALQKLQYELFYIKHMSIAFDLLIWLATVKTVLVRRGS